MSIDPTPLDARLGSGLTQREAAKQMKLSYVHLCRLERGHEFPTNKMLQRLANFYGRVFTVRVMPKGGKR